MYAVLTVFTVREDPAQVHPSEQANEVGERHPESTVVAISKPWAIFV